MPDHVRVSVVMTTYNHEKYIQESIESVLLQKQENLELIVIDDGSSDRTHEIASKYDNSNVHVLKKPNGGPGDAFNFGAKNARGDIIVLFSGDDVMTPYSIQMRVDALRAGTAGAVCSIPRWIDGNGSVIPWDRHPNSFKRFSGLKPAALFSRLYFEGNFVCAPSVAMYANVWRTVGMFNKSLWQLQDYEYWMRLSAQGISLICLDEPCVSYRWHGENLSNETQASRSEFEHLAIWISAPRLLGREMLLSVVFGEAFSDYPVDLTDEDLLSLVYCRHHNSGIRQYGKRKLFFESDFSDVVERVKKSVAIL